MSKNEGTELVKRADNTASVSVPCIICGSFVDLNERETRAVLNGQRPAKVCSGCKGAVMFIKQQMMQAGL